MIQEGDLIGPRQNMGYTCTNEKIYIFGGDLMVEDDKKEYYNDFYEIEIKENEAVFKRIVNQGPQPEKRSRHSLLNLHNKYLILLGGESITSTFKDIWSYNLAQNHWSLLYSTNQISDRISFSSCLYKNNLIIFGGLSQEKSVLSDICVLSFSNSQRSLQGEISIKNQTTNTPDKFYTCPRCLHSQEICCLLSKYPEISNPNLNFFVKVQTSNKNIDYFANEFLDPLAALIRIIEIIGKDAIDINFIGEGYTRNNSYVKIAPEPIKIDFSFLLGAKLDEEFKIRQSMLSN